MILFASNNNLRLLEKPAKVKIVCGNLFVKGGEYM